MNRTKALAAIFSLIAITACQHGNSYKIDGTADGFSSGDTLLLTNDMNEGTPIDTIIVNEGKFALEGEIDSAGFYMIYALNRPDHNVQFFLEPGNISLTLSGDREKTHVGGTTANDNWQKLNEEVMAFGKRIQQLAQQPMLDNPEEEMSEEQQLELNKQIQAITNELNERIIKTAEENIDNELGFFILTNFDDYDILTPERWRELIAKMPEKYRQRKEVKDIDAILNHEPDLSSIALPQPDGTILNVMEEVGKHKLTLLDFWASWCGPCRQEMPAMKQLYEQYKDKGLGIIGISLDNNADDWKRGIKELGITWTQISDLQGWGAQPAKEFQVRSIPHIVVVDSQGKILTKGLRGEALEQFVKEHL
jgi:thiol-disulfide isomerase/thioredoxin